MPISSQTFLFPWVMGSVVILVVEPQDDYCKSLILQENHPKKRSKNHKPKVICADSCPESYSFTVILVVQN